MHEDGKAMPRTKARMSHFVTATRLTVTLLMMPFAAYAQDERWLCKHAQGDRICGAASQETCPRTFRRHEQTFPGVRFSAVQ